MNEQAAGEQAAGEQAAGERAAGAWGLDAGELDAGERDELDALVARALVEDIGSGDVTSAATVPAGLRAIARITQKAPGVVYGLDVAARVFRAVDPDVVLAQTGPEGVWRENGPVMEITGPATALLAAERTALNFLQQLSGVATLTARCVRAVAVASASADADSATATESATATATATARATGARVLDTRKTVPGMRMLQKRAVLAGGGMNHRIGLYDAVLIKENHAAMCGGVGAAVRAAAAYAPQLPLEVECTDLAEVREALAAVLELGGERERFRILLDNMDEQHLREAVAAVAGRVQLEASGGFTLDGIGAVARTGVDFISVGALTHSAPALDLSLLLEPLQ